MINSKTKSALVKKLNIFVGRRQCYGTDVCLVEHRAHYLRLAHLLDNHGIVVKGATSVYAGMVNSLKKGWTPNDPDAKHKRCTACGETKHLLEFNAGKKSALGSAAKCRTCTCVEDKTRRYLKKDDVVFRCNRVILKRQATNTAYVLISERERHKPVSHMLDDIGMVKPEFKGTYEGFIKLSGTDRGKREREKTEKQNELKVIRATEKLERDVQKRLEKELKHKRKLDLFASRVNPLDAGITLEYITYERFRTRIRKVCKNRCGQPPEGFGGRYGRSRNEYYVQQFGYSESELLNHLESSIPEGMSWRDYASGALHLDHKSPLALFDVFDPVQLRNAYALGNLQLLRATENIKKSCYCDITDTYC